jgi:hypothetical protein
MIIRDIIARQTDTFMSNEVKTKNLSEYRCENLKTCIITLCFVLLNAYDLIKTGILRLNNGRLAS